MASLTHARALVADLADVTNRTLQLRGWGRGDGTLWFRVVQVDPGTGADSLIFGDDQYTLEELTRVLTFALTVARLVGKEKYDG